MKINIVRRVLWLNLLLLMVTFLSSGLRSSVYAAELVDYSSMPPFLTAQVTPNVMVMLDNSGSMKHSLYDGGSWRCVSYGNDFNPGKEYYGLFDEAQNYTYDTTIEVDSAGYNGVPYDVPDINATPGAFVASTCTPGIGVNC